MMRKLLLALALIMGAISPAAAQGCGQGNPNCVAPTAPPGDNSNRIANTAWVTTNSGGSGGGGALAINAAQNNIANWTCAETDQSTQAQALINGVAALGGGTIVFPPCPPAHFNATTVGTQLTVNSLVSGTITVPSIIAGDSILPNFGNRTGPRTTIINQVSGTPGGAGVYTLSQAAFSNSTNVLTSQPCYRADSQLVIPTLSGPVADAPNMVPLRLTGQGGGFNLQSSTFASTIDNAACLDLRFQGVSMSGVGYTIAGGSGYTSGTSQQTLTLSGGAGPAATLGTIVAGSGGTPGTYNNVNLLNGTGSGAQGTVVVGAGGTVSSVTLSNNGVGYSKGDVLAIQRSQAGNVSGATVAVATVTTNFNCATPPQWQVVVSGGVVQNGTQGSLTPSGTDGSIKVTRPGSCTIVPNNPVTVTSTDAGVGATFNVYWTGGKIYSVGAGNLQIDHLAINDAGTVNSTALIYTIDTFLNLYDNNFNCSFDQNQDAIVQGGLLGTAGDPPNVSADSPSLGFLSSINHNQTNGCGRFYFGRTFQAQVSIINNAANGLCVGDRFIEFLSTQTGVLAPYVANNYSEQCTHFRYGIVFNNVTNGTFVNNSFYDLATYPGYQFDYFFQDNVTGSAQNTILTGYGCSNYATQPPCATTNTNAGHPGSAAQIVGTIVGGSPQPANNPIGNQAVYQQTGGAAIIVASYNPSNCPPGAVTLTNLSNAATYLELAADRVNNSRLVIDALNSSNCAGSSVGNPNSATLQLNPSGSPVAFEVLPNDTGTGTGNTLLVKLTAAGNAVTTATTDTSGIIGIAAAGAGNTSGTTVSVITGGLVWCHFDGANTIGDYVQNSTTNAGQCHDAGATKPPSGQIIGKVTQSSTPFAQIQIYGPEQFAQGSGAEQTNTFQPGLVTAIVNTKGAFSKWVKASTVDNIEVSATQFTCTVNPTVSFFECGTSTTCASPTTIGSATITAAGTVVDGTVSAPAIAAGDYTSWSVSAGTCTVLDIAGQAQAHANN